MTIYTTDVDSFTLEEEIQINLLFNVKYRNMYGNCINLSKIITSKGF
jgi:hypothetical protein